MGLDVVLEDALGLGLTQHAQRAVQPVNVAVTVTTNLSSEEAGAGSQVEDTNLEDVKRSGDWCTVNKSNLMVKSELDEGLGTLDVAVVVAHNDQIVIVLLGPVVIELDCVLRQRVIHEDLLDLFLKLLGGGTVQVVREPDILCVMSIF